MQLALIDVNALGFAAMYQPALANLSFHGHPTAALHGVLSSILSLMKTFPEDFPVVLWDGHAQWRYDVLPVSETHDGYKGTRADNEDKLAIRSLYKQQVPYIKLLLQACGIPQIMPVDSEADDVAGHLCRHLPASTRIRLVTKDTDWYQAIAPNVCWYSPLSRVELTDDDFRAPRDDEVPEKDLTFSGKKIKDGPFLSTQEYLDAKALAGDSSDCIPGVPGLGLVTACGLMRKHGGLENFWAKVDSGAHTPKGTREVAVAAQETRAMFARNKKLMDWRNAPPLSHEIAVVCTGPDVSELEAIAEQFGLTKVLGSAKAALIDRDQSRAPMAAVLKAIHQASYAD